MSVKVNIIEYERGWGQRLDEIREFPDFASAEAFIADFNSANDKKEVPDWYMKAILA